MEKPKLYLNMILAETETTETVKRCLDSVKDYVDGCYIAITYKEQEPNPSHPLCKLLTSYGVKILTFKWIYNFAAARQFVMDNTPHGPDCYIIWLDADDIFKNAAKIPFLLETTYRQQWGALFLNYLYIVDLDEKGEIREVVVEHKRERIIRNDNSFKWIGRLHETLIEQKTENVIKAWQKEFDDCVVVHLTDDERMGKNLDRNLAILEEQAKSEQHKDPRTLIYLAKGYLDKGKLSPVGSDDQKILFDLSLALFEEYLQGSGEPGSPGYQEGSGWKEERSTAWAYIGEVARSRGQFNIAIRALHNAIIECPYFPNYYIDLAMIYSMKGDHQSAKHWLGLATSVTIPETTIITTPRDLKTRALEVDYNIALSEGKFDRAVEDSQLLVNILPNFAPLQERLLTVESIRAANKAAQSIVYLGKYLEDIKEPEKIIPLIESIPNDLQLEKFTSEMKHRFLPPRIWKENEIAIVCGPGVEVWSPKSIETGLGGSEEAVVYLAQELTKLGWKVTVFANPQKEAGVYDGVTYKQWYDMNMKDRFNVMILWRTIGAVDLNLSARFTMVWMHDVPSNPDFTEDRVSKVNKIAVLSEYHKSILRFSVNGEFVAPSNEKIFVTANGITPITLDSTWKRDFHRMIYASSPDRGLVYLLNMWPEIKKQDPKATLDVFYGFKVYDVLHGGNPARMEWKNKLLQMMKQDGVSYKGRIGHQQLIEEYAKAGIWAYPTDFCVTGDTLVDMPRNYLNYPMGIPIKELVGKENMLTWTFNEKTGDFELKKIIWVKKTKEKADIIKINWGDGTSLKCTPDHKILTYDRGWVEAKDLQTNESVVAFKKHINIEVSARKGRWPSEHRLIAEKVLGPIPAKYHVDHIDGNPFNNSPDNFQYLSPSEHAKKTFTGNKKTKQSLEKQVESYKKWSQTEKGKQVLKESGSKRGHKFWDNITAREKELFIEKREVTRKQKYQEWWTNLPNEQKETWGDKGREVLWNHKVKSIEKIKSEDVYDMLVEDNHNFIAGGVVIHNCEISCISAMKAQASGAIPVVTNFAALKETVRNGLKVDVDITTKEGQEEYIKSLVGLLKDKKTQEMIRLPMMKWAQDYFLWSHVAEQWDTLFKRELKVRKIVSVSESEE